MNEVATQNRSPLVGFKQDLKRLKDAGEIALPSTVSYDAFKNALIVAVSDNPMILQCNKESVFKAVRTLAGAGLVPDGREAAIVPFKGQAQAMPMVSGLIKVARNSGKVKSLWADVVYEGEVIETWVEDGERRWDHRREDGGKIDAMSRGGDIRGAYAVAKLSDGSVDFQPMSLDEIEKRRKASSNQRGPAPTGIWEKWYDEMAKKTVIRNLCKRLPMSTEDIDRIMVEQDQPQMRDVTPKAEAEAPRKTLAQRMAEEKPVEGEVMGPETNESAPESGEPDPFAPEYDEGRKAAQEGASLGDCPHEMGTQKWVDWAAGWKFQDDQEDEA